jgi:hypothetical protein
MALMRLELYVLKRGFRRGGKESDQADAKTIRLIDRRNIFRLTLS